MIFVFGSNELGIHGRGAAREALDKYGAVYNQGFGPQGNSFAIPTCSRPAYPGTDFTISKDRLKYYVGCFLDYAKESVFEFKITRIGCGLAGWKDEEVAPLFIFAPSNCYFDEKWKMYLPTKNFWGTHE